MSHDFQKPFTVNALTHNPDYSVFSQVIGTASTLDEAVVIGNISKKESGFDSYSITDTATGTAVLELHDWSDEWERPEWMDELKFVF